METKNDHPGIYIPPPLIYIAFFLLSKLIQKYMPLEDQFFSNTVSHFLGIIILLVGFFFNVPALRQFFQSKNTLVTIRPANSLQTSGIFSISRNPMYISLAFFYLGLGFLIGNWWTFILFPFLLLLVQEYIIKREERYLERRFGEEYLVYKNKVRRWL